MKKVTYERTFDRKRYLLDLEQGQPGPDARISCCPLNFQGRIPQDATLNAALLSAQLLVANSLVLAELGLDPVADRISVFRLLDAGVSALST